MVSLKADTGEGPKGNKPPHMYWCCWMKETVDMRWKRTPWWFWVYQLSLELELALPQEYSSIKCSIPLSTDTWKKPCHESDSAKVKEIHLSPWLSLGLLRSHVHSVFPKHTVPRIASLSSLHYKYLLACLVSLSDCEITRILKLCLAHTCWLN